MLKCGLPGGGVKSSKIAPTRLCLLHPGDVYLYARAVTRECAKTGANRGVYGLSSMLSREPLTISLRLILHPVSLDSARKGLGVGGVG